MTTSTGMPREERSHGWVAGVVVAALAALTVAGCDSQGDDGAGGASSSAGGRASRAPAPQTASGQPTAPAAPAVTAADGRDIGACTDGDCAIAVSEPVTIRFEGPAGPATLSVTAVGPDMIEYAVKSGSNRSEGRASGPGQGCVTVLRANGGGNSCGGLGNAARPSPRPDAVVIQAATGRDGTAVLHIVSG